MTNQFINSIIGSSTAIGLVLFSLVASAIEPLDQNAGTILGVSAGTYRAEGVLESYSMWIPDADFRSVRRLQGDVIEATTKAYLLGHEIAQAKARLKVVPGANGSFDLLDLDKSDARAGGGTCNARFCRFTVTVMGGNLTLTETWLATSTGFSIVDGSQDYNGAEATYQADFKPVAR